MATSPLRPPEELKAIATAQAHQHGRRLLRHLMRSMVGICQHCAEEHLHGYLAEYDFRYNRRSRLGFSDMGRAMTAVKGAEGKRLTYRQPDGARFSI